MNRFNKLIHSGLYLGGAEFGVLSYPDLCVSTTIVTFLANAK